MSSKSWLYLVGAIVTEVAASLSLKGALNHPALYGVVAVGYVSAFTCLSFTLRAGMALGVAYGVWGATGVAATALLSSLFFGEPITPIMGAGILLVMGGVLLVELGAQEAAEYESPEEIKEKVAEVLASETPVPITVPAALLTPETHAPTHPQGPDPHGSGESDQREAPASYIGDTQTEGTNA